VAIWWWVRLQIAALRFAALAMTLVAAAVFSASDYARPVEEVLR
jgi:hypothetical protein